MFVTVGIQFRTTYTTTNADASAVTLSMSGLPSGATFNPTSGLFSWFPSVVEPVGNLRFIYLVNCIILWGNFILLRRIHGSVKYLF